jgi:hypothetical protein
MIFYRNLAEDLIRIDSYYCSDCLSPLRAAFKRAAERGNSNFLKCAHCGTRWIPTVDVDEVAGSWVMVLSSADPLPTAVAVLCVDCARAHPEPMSVLAIARLALRQSPGPLQ